MTKSERTRRYIIESTAPVFNMRGFDGTTLAALQEATGLTKGSLYGNFEDKEEIAREAFNHSMRLVRETFNERIRNKQTAKEKLVAVFECFGEYVFNPPVPGGCPLLNNAIEADDHHTSMKDAVAEEITSVINFIARLLLQGVRSREFRQDVRTKELAYLFFSSLEGALMISRVSSSDAAMKAVVKNCRSILDQISL
jgi:TetR/AcrR family transcriptional regulator, transcriptional repressor for nem operon